MEVIGIDAGQPHAPPGVYIRATTAVVERPWPQLVGWEPVEGYYALYRAVEEMGTKRQLKPIYVVYVDGEVDAVFEADRREQWKQALVWAMRRVRQRGDELLTIGYPGRWRQRWREWTGYRPPKPKHVSVTSALKSPRKHFTAMLDPDIL